MEFFKEFFEETKLFFKQSAKYIKFIIVILLFLLSSIFQLIPVYLFNLDYNNMSIFTKCCLTLFSNLVVLIIYIILYYKDLKKNLINLKKMGKKKLGLNLDTAFRYWLIGLIIMIGSNFIISKLGISSSTNDTSIQLMLNNSPIIAGISVLFVAPFVEEIAFRLSFKKVIDNKWIYIFTSGIIFGAMHVVFSLSNIYELLYLIPYCSLGISFAFIYNDTDNIYISYLIHIIHNFLVALTTFLLAGVILW